MASGLTLKGKKAVVLGANASGVALTRFLIKRGATPSLVDFGNAEAAKAYLEDKLDAARYNLVVGEVPQSVFDESNLVVVSRGIPLDLKVLEATRLQGIPVLSELDFFALYNEEPVIAIAGTKGKSTTAHLLTKMLEAAGKTVFSNINQPAAAYLNQSKPVDYVILCANTFQLEGAAHFKPKMVLMLNVAEDHADRYPNFESYLATHREVLKNADQDTCCIFNSQDSHVASWVAATPALKLCFSSQMLEPGVEGAWATRQSVIARCEATQNEEAVFDLKLYRLRGAHNRENFAAAALAALKLGVKPAQIQSIIEEVRTLPHRLEFVKRLNSVAFYNDSAAANVQAVLRSLQSFTEPVILISGGRDKNADYTSLSSHIRQRVKNLILVGEAKEKMNRQLGDFTETFLVGTIEEAVLLAYQKSRSGDVVLLSPGADSSDQFSSHEERGEYFKKLVTQIAQPRRPNVI